MSDSTTIPAAAATATTPATAEATTETAAAVPNPPDTSAIDVAGAIQQPPPIPSDMAIIPGAGAQANTQDHPISVRLVRPNEKEACAAVVNEAFLYDAFFKKPEHHNRLSDEGKEISTMMTGKDCVLVAVDDKDEIVGVVHVQIDEERKVGGFGMLAVSKSRARSGIGKMLVRAAGEDVCVRVYVRVCACVCVCMCVHVCA